MMCPLTGEERSNAMQVSRRNVLCGGAAAAAVGILGPKVLAGDKPAAKEPALIGACGLACKTCPLMKAGKCKGCASGKEATPELLKMKPCPVLKCAAMKKIDYCGTGCKGFTKCSKIIGKPYDKNFIAMIAKRLA